MRRGLSLLEVILTSSLLGLCALFLLGVLPGAMLSVRQSEHRIGASALAKAILDECAAGPFADLSVGVFELSSPGALGDMLRRQQYQLDDQTLLNPRLEISNLTPETLRKLKVTVKWRERNTDFEIIRELKLSSLQR